jgi:hypothetical protein
MLSGRGGTAAPRRRPSRRRGCRSGRGGRGRSGRPEQVLEGHRLEAVRARAAGADPPAEDPALGAALLSEVALLAERALVDALGARGVVGGDGGGAPVAVCLLATGRRAVALASLAAIAAPAGRARVAGESARRMQGSLGRVRARVHHTVPLGGRVGHNAIVTRGTRRAPALALPARARWRAARPDPFP